jgi:hypothetical protein
VTLALASRRTALTPPWVRNDLWRRARAVPSLDLRFADNKSLTDAVTGASLVTFTRASNGTYTDSAGVLQTAATNVPRFDHNPTTGESLGLLVEEQRTNSITNNTMVGAVAGTPGTNPTGWVYATAQSNGLTLSIVGTGVENGINYIDYRFNGTTVASPNTCLIGIVNASAATAQTWTASTYWKLAAGSTTGIINWQLGLIENTAGGTFVTGAFYSQTAPTSAALNTQRPIATRTLSGGATVGLVVFPISVTVTGNAAIDFTIRIGLPQLEQGAFATSAIPTTTAAATRTADVASITGSAFSGWYRQDEGTVFADCKVIGDKGSSQFIYSISDGALGDEIRLFKISGNSAISNAIEDSVDGTTSNISGNTNSPFGQSFKTAYAFANNYASRTVGGLASGVDNSVTVPAVNQIRIGARMNGSFYSDLYLSRLTYWPQRLADSTLQQITQ